jgi:hypothetical protein
MSLTARPPRAHGNILCPTLVGKPPVARCSCVSDTAQVQNYSHYGEILKSVWFHTRARLRHGNGRIVSCPLRML